MILMIQVLWAFNKLEKFSEKTILLDIKQPVNYKLPPDIGNSKADLHLLVSESFFYMPKHEMYFQMS